MTFKLHYTGQLVSAAGLFSGSVKARKGERFAGVLEKLAANGRDISSRPLVLTPSGKMQRSLLLVVGGEQWIGDRDTFTPEDGMEITLRPPMSGG